MEALRLERGPETLHGGVIVTASLPAHAGADLAGVQELAEGTGGVLNSAIRMMDVGGDAPEFARTFESLMNHRRGQGSREFPAQETFGTKIQFRGQIKPAILLGRQVGQISTPDLVGRTRANKSVTSCALSCKLSDMSLGRIVLAPPERRELTRRARKRSLAAE